MNAHPTQQELLELLRDRFHRHQERHVGVQWSGVLDKLAANPGVLAVLSRMETTGGEPDVVILDKEAGWVFCDCSPESPSGRRSLCYDREALDARKQAKPAGNAIEMAADLGVDLLTEAQYRTLQGLGEFDRKTSSWVKTPERIRQLGGAIFCDRRYDHVFVYHNGAESYYAARGFRGLVRL